MKHKFYHLTALTTLMIVLSGYAANAQGVVIGYLSSTPSNIPTEARPAIETALIEANDEFLQASELTIIDARWEGNWGLATVTTANLSNSTGSHTPIAISNMHSLIIIRVDGKWQAAVDGSPHVPELLNQLPFSELSDTARKAVFGRSFVVATANQYQNYKLPWASDTPFQLTQDWHDDGFDGSIPYQNALDFDVVGANNANILAAAPGTIVGGCVGPNLRHAGIIIQTTNTTDRLLYLHLDYPTMNPNAVQGNTVQQGEYLGRMVEGFNNDLPCGIQDNTHIHLGFSTLPFTMDEYTFSKSTNQPLPWGVNLSSSQGSGGSTGSNAPKWDFAAGNNQGWSKRVNLSAENSSNFFDGGMWMQLTANDPWIEGPTTSFSASDFPIFHLYISSAADSCGEVYFRRSSDGGFTGSRQRSIPIVKNTEQSYIVDMRTNGNWNGTISQVRVDPACNMQQNSPNAVRINLIRFATPDTSWDFAEGNSLGWDTRNSLSAPNFFDDGMWMAVQGSDPFVESPPVAFKASSYRYAIIEMASTTDTCGQVYFTKDQDGFSSSKAIGFTVNPNGSDHVYVVDMKSNSNYKGVITQLRVDPACSPKAGAGNAVRINRIVMSNVAPPTDGDTNNDGRITPADAVYVINRLGTNDLFADVTGDGNVTQSDVNVVYNKIGQSVP